MGTATAVSDIERAEHLNYADGKGVKRVTAYNDGVQVNVATEENQNPTDAYSFSDKDEAGATKYYGFLNKTGAWYIMSYDGSSARYVKGTSGYNWANRASETYDTFDNVF